jgi:hypothetical protein
MRMEQWNNRILEQMNNRILELNWESNVRGFFRNGTFYTGENLFYLLKMLFHRLYFQMVALAYFFAERLFHSLRDGLAKRGLNTIP